MREATDIDALMGIGGISKATGVPVATLRTWERRYGFPTPVRLPSGHRRYSPDLIEHVRLINVALKHGIKASTALTITRSALRVLVESSRPEAPVSARRAPKTIPSARFTDFSAVQGEQLLTELQGGNDAALDQAMRRAQAAFGTMEFMHGWLTPYLAMLGQAWRDGRISVSDEHASSERIRAFLTNLWRPISDRSDGKVVVLSTLPSERHDLGLHMAATALALSGAVIAFLGADTPLRDIESKARYARASGVVLSLSAAADSSSTLDLVHALRDSLGDDVALAIGGQGWVHHVAGVDAPGSLAELRQWFNTLQ